MQRERIWPFPLWPSADGTNAFAGFNACSSKNLYNWKFDFARKADSTAPPHRPTTPIYGMVGAFSFNPSIFST